MKQFIVIILIGHSLTACEEEKIIPKPPTYLRLELPDHTYVSYEDDCGYKFDISSLYKVEKSPEENGSTCHKRIQLGPLNGTIYLRYWEINDSLAYYINSANDEVDKHKLKAENIIDEKVLRPEDKVYGTFFELTGDVATPFQFYLTDSTDRFVYGEVLFNSTPNYDSLRPTLEYLKADLKQFTGTLQWK